MSEREVTNSDLEEVGKRYAGLSRDTTPHGQEKLREFVKKEYEPTLQKYREQQKDSRY